MRYCPNDPDNTDRSSAFENALDELNIEHKKIRPYSSWQNGKVERSHMEDGKYSMIKRFLK